MRLKAIVHDAEESGFWAEVPAIPGCVAQGDSMEELMAHLQDAVAACMSIDVAPSRATATARIVEIAV
jgi:predicted RNase H-like HicB family nuclease